MRVFFRGGQDDHFDHRLLGADEPRRGQAVKLGHIQVHEHDVGAELACLVHGFASVAGLADHLDSARLEQTARSITKQRVIVGYQYAHEAV
jgi:hypothetical protein